MSEGTLNIYTASVTELRGVGKVREKMYSKLGIYTVWDLLRHFPRAYENRGKIIPLCAAPEDIRCSAIMTVASEPHSAKLQSHLTVTKFKAFDDSGVCEIIYFNQPYIEKKFSVGDTFRFWGRVEKKGHKYSMCAPAAEPYNEDKPLPELYPVYRLTDGLSMTQIQKDISSALSSASLTLEDTLPYELQIKHELPTLQYALRTIHSPESYEALAKAKRRLMYDELFSFAIGLRMTHERHEREPAFACTDSDVSPFLSLLGYELTDGQKNTVRNIKEDMSKPFKMSRIVVGDVGCGKTVCAAAAMYIAVRNGRQAALMVPTEILANQHYKDLKPLFSSLGISCELLTGSVGTAEKRRIREGLASDSPSERINIVIGTQALLSDGVEFCAPGVVVTDEQHRFGVRQRAVLSDKNVGSHLLVMSATPIPRSLALVMYEDLDISRITDMPPGRQRVDTFVVDERYRERLNAFIRKLVGEGGQVYIVCPSVETYETADDEISFDDISSDGTRRPRTKLKAAVQYAEELAKFLDGITVAFVHGKMKTAEKDRVMSDFASGKIQVLVSTTVIEVGVNVPNACLMIVENAERFGLSQLHQLRGRVGRGSRKSYCVLVNGEDRENNCDGPSNAAKRLDIMRSTNDGYAIAEKDLQIRGPGDFIASCADGNIRQSGGTKFRLADMCDDSDLFDRAVADAAAMLAEDPELVSHPGLREEVMKMFKIDPSSIS